jgi:hypothetical protein
LHNAEDVGVGRRAGGWRRARVLKDMEFAKHNWEAASCDGVPAFNRFGDASLCSWRYQGWPALKAVSQSTATVDCASGNGGQAVCRDRSCASSPSGSAEVSTRTSRIEDGRPGEPRCLWIRRQRRETPTLCESLEGTMWQSCCSHPMCPLCSGGSVVGATCQDVPLYEDPSDVK